MLRLRSQQPLGLRETLLYGRVSEIDPRGSASKLQIEDFGLQNQSRDREGADNRPGGAAENSPGSPAGLQKAAAGGLNRPWGFDTMDITNSD